MTNKKYALVTGAASGIGLEISHLLALRGYALVVVDINEETLQQLKLQFESTYKVDVIILKIDLSDLNAAKNIFEFCETNHLEIEVLINNAGIFFFGEVTDTPIKKAGDLLTIHVYTSSMLAVYFSKRMKEKKCGYILFVSSISAYKNFPGIAFYGSSKSYLKSFAQALRMELKYYNIYVTATMPGATATNLYNQTNVNVTLGKKLGVFMDAQKVAQKSVAALFNNKPKVIPGIANKIIVALLAITPYWFIYWLRKKNKGLF